MTATNSYMDELNNNSVNRKNRKSNYSNEKHAKPMSLNVEDISTIELLNKKSKILSTERLINEPIPNLLKEIEDISDPEYDSVTNSVVEDNISQELAHFNNIKISENDQLLNDYNNVATLQKQPKDNRIHENIPSMSSTKDRFEEELLEVLPKLYNRIQVFLLRNKLSLNFLKRFKSYIGYLIEFGFNPLTDEYLIEVQDCLSESFALTYEMESVLKRFLFKPDNLILKLVNYQFNKDSNLLQMEFSLWKIKFVTQNSLMLYEKFIKAKFLHRWSYLFNKYGVEYKEQSNNFNKARLKEFGFDKLLIAYETLQQMSIVADSKFKQTIFTRFRKAYSLLIEDEKTFKQRRDDLIRKHYFKTWILKFKLNEYNMGRIPLKSKILSKIKKKYNDREIMTNEAISSRYFLLTKRFILIWRKRLNEKNEKHDKLILLYKKSLKGRYFSKLLSSYKLSQSVTTAKDHLNRTLMSHILREIWFKRLQERLHLYSIALIQDEAIKKRYFRLITKHFYLQIKAYQFRRDSLFKYIWVSWRKQYHLQTKLEQFKGDNCRRRHFELWNHQTKLILRYRNSVLSKLYSRYFIIWRDRSKKISNLNERELNFYNGNLKRKILQRVKSRITKIEKLNENYNVLIKTKIFTKIKRSCIKLEVLKVIENSEWPQIYSKMLMNNYLQKWKYLYNELKEKKLKDILTFFVSHQETTLLNKYFQIYYNRSIILSRNLIFIADDMNNHRLMKKFFNIVLSKFNDHQSEYFRADMLRNNRIIYENFILWKYRLDELNNLLQRATNEKNLYLLSSYLRLWSMNHFKLARNERTVQLFRQRWERATVRGLIALWKMKTENRQQSAGNQFEDLGNPDFDDEGNFSDSSNISPHHIVELKTPKRQVGTTTIPGSLQMRRYKMQEMISHYNKARIIPSPLKESSTLPNTVKKRLQSNAISRQMGFSNDIGVQTKTPGKLRFSDLTSLRPPSNSRQLKHRSQSVLNGSPERRIPISRLSKSGFAPA